MKTALALITAALPAPQCANHASGYVTQTNYLAAQQPARIKDMADLLQRMSAYRRSHP